MTWTDDIWVSERGTFVSSNTWKRETATFTKEQVFGEHRLEDGDGCFSCSCAEWFLWSLDGYGDHRAEMERARLTYGLGIEKYWYCEVEESGFHNGAGCGPDEPHQEWRCGIRFRVTASQDALDTLRKERADG